MYIYVYIKAVGDDAEEVQRRLDSLADHQLWTRAFDSEAQATH